MNNYSVKIWRRRLFKTVIEVMEISADEFDEGKGVVSFWIGKNGSFCNGAELVGQFKAEKYSVVKNNSQIS
jgi:hypothetical protein